MIPNARDKMQGDNMVKILTTHWLKPIPSNKFDWSALDSDTYDGAEDSSNRNHIGYGATEAEAIADLMTILEEAGL